MSTSEVFTQFFAKLARSLPMDDPIFVAELFSHDLLPGDHYDKVKSPAKTRAEKATHFLDSVIKPTISTDDGRCFIELLNVMEDSDFGIKELAQQIRSKLREEPQSTENATC